MYTCVCVSVCVCVCVCVCIYNVSDFLTFSFFFFFIHCSVVSLFFFFFFSSFISFFFFLYLVSRCISAWVICIFHSLSFSHHSLCISRSCNSCARALRVWLNFPSRLIVSFLLEPASWIPAEVESSRLVVDEDGEHEGKGGQPPNESETHHQCDTCSFRYDILYIYIYLISSFISKNTRLLEEKLFFCSLMEARFVEQKIDRAHLRGNMRRPLSMPGV